MSINSAIHRPLPCEKPRPRTVKVGHICRRANDGELGGSVKPLPSGLVGSSPTGGTKMFGVTKFQSARWGA